MIYLNKNTANLSPEELAKYIEEKKEKQREYMRNYMKNKLNNNPEFLKQHKEYCSNWKKANPDGKINDSLTPEEREEKEQKLKEKKNEYRKKFILKNKDRFLNMKNE